jgi:hypothetical protein
MDDDELINKLLEFLNELINKGCINVKITKSSNELLETLKIIESRASCKKDNNIIQLILF